MDKPETVYDATITGSRWRFYLALLRPRQWTKNGFVLAGALFSGLFTNPQSMLTAIIAFFIFCLVSSAGYIYNDILDKDEDAHHPKKRHRPIAAWVKPKN